MIDARRSIFFFPSSVRWLVDEMRMWLPLSRAAGADWRRGRRHIRAVAAAPRGKHGGSFLGLSHGLGMDVTSDTIDTIDTVPGYAPTAGRRHAGRAACWNTGTLGRNTASPDLAIPWPLAPDAPFGGRMLPRGRPAARRAGTGGQLRGYLSPSTRALETCSRAFLHQRQHCVPRSRQGAIT